MWKPATEWASGLLGPDEHAVGEAVLVEPAAEGQVLAEAVAVPDGLDAGFDSCSVLLVLTLTCLSLRGCLRIPEVVIRGSKLCFASR